MRAKIIFPPRASRHSKLAPCPSKCRTGRTAAAPELMPVSYAYSSFSFMAVESLPLSIKGHCGAIRSRPLCVQLK